MLTQVSYKLSSKIFSQKCYWSILKSFFNGKKILRTLPVIHNDEFITEFRERSELFNTLFAQQRSLVENSNTLPTGIFEKIDKSLLTIYFFEQNKLKITRLLDPNKAHGYDNILTFNVITQGIDKSSFIFLMTPIDSTNDKNICLELVKATFIH